MRTNLVNSSIKFEDFFVPFTKTLSVNWPYQEDDVLLASLDPEDPMAVRLNPVFESHLQNIDNWSVGMAFKQAHPHLVGEETRVEN